MTAEESKSEIKIVVDAEYGSREFEEDFFYENLLKNFIDVDYIEKKKELDNCLNNVNMIRLAAILHKIKTLLGYMNCVDMVEECKKIEHLVQEANNYSKQVVSRLPNFIGYFTKLHEEAERVYELKFPPLNKENDPEVKQTNDPLKEEKDIPSLIKSPSHEGRTKLDDDQSIQFSSPIAGKSFSVPAFFAPRSDLIADKKIRNQDFINIESGTIAKSFTYGQNEESVNPIQLDRSLVSVEKQEYTPELKAKLKEFAEIQSPRIVLSLKSIIESRDPKALIEIAEALKKIAGLLYFNRLAMRIDSIPINSLHENQIKPITCDLLTAVEYMIAEANEITSGKTPIKPNKNYFITAPHSNVGQGTQKPKIIKDINNSPGGKRAMGNQNSIVNFNSYTMGKGGEDDNTLADMKQIKLDGLYKTELTQDEIEMEIKKLTQTTPLLTAQANRPKKLNLNENSYPFKQETYKLNCTIF